ncbi:TPA: hypothetical protein I2T90_02645 [Staphylococcus aureus]|nr:hypothetical protein [Staphylococcus aureus]MSN61034.1 hypothetical protein [Staphylococcus aureus]MSN69423.1 hypothetical protein [Staphylococcus aureus]MSN76997.1 hypothetical protein [Staphylococcus aureus]NKI86403.1 hypothetical protein [Staphylococcus aureus]
MGGAPTQKLTKSQISIMCKLGSGPQHREIGPQFQQAMQVGDGAPTQRNWTPISTGNASWGKDIDFVKISFLSHSLCMSLIMYSFF